MGIGSGLSDMELGLRLRYEIRREFAPYIGVNWTQKIGRTADFAKDEGEETSDVQLVAGIGRGSEVLRRVHHREVENETNEK